MSKLGNKAGRDRCALTDKRWLAYSLAAGASGVAASPAAGVVEYFNIDDISISQGYTQPLYINDDTYIDITLNNYIFLNGNYQGAFIPFAPGRVFGFRAGPSNFAYATALYGGEMVDAAAMSANVFNTVLAYGATDPNAQFNNVTDAYIGFSFPAGSDLHYAWVRVDVDNAAGTFIIKDFAFENVPGVGILAGATTSGASVPGDADGDGDVDLDDFDILTANYDTLIGGGASVGDFDNDGDVDFDDFVIQAQNMPFGGPDAEAEALPEPGTLGFLAAGSAGLVFLRRRRGRG